MTSHIPTLLLREWMQHKRGWLIAAFAPPLIFLALLPFSQMDGMPDDAIELVALAATVSTACVCYAICLLVAVFQLPGLARRDQQDRSIEFWLSLPGRPSESVASTVLAHAWLAPVGGALIGALFGLPIALSVIATKLGVGNALALHWGEVIAAALPLMLRGLAGTVVMTLWLLPTIFVLMAASSWLKRLGVPLVMVGGGALVTLAYKVYDIVWPVQALMDLNTHINHALLYDGRGLMTALRGDDSLWVHVAHDLGRTLAELASVQFLGWMALAAAGFALVVMKRSRAG